MEPPGIPGRFIRRVGPAPCWNLYGEDHELSWPIRSTQQLTVNDPNPAGPYVLPTLAFPLGNYTDQWWDPAEPGWGLAITQHVDGAIFAVGAVYGPDNKPIWYTLQPGSWTAYNTYSGPVYRTMGPYFGGSYANGPPVTETSGNGDSDVHRSGEWHAAIQCR